MKTALSWLIGGVFLAAVLGANYLTTRYGQIPVGLGLTATAGTYLAGLTFILRDSLHDVAGRRGVLAAIAVGAVLSFTIADPRIALASAVAFAVSETSDMAVYLPLRRRGYLRAAIASNVVGIVVDTLLFLWIAGFPVTQIDFAGQFLAKIALTAIVATGVVMARCSTSQTPAVGP